jgi:hypothetical protein
MNASLHCNRFVQSHLNIALDNYGIRPYGFLELNSGGNILTDHNLRLMFLHVYGLRYQFTLAHTDKNLISNEYSPIDFNIETMKIGEVGDEVKPASNGALNLFS